jgi:hypothetical protein
VAAMAGVLAAFLAGRALTGSPYGFVPTDGGGFFVVFGFFASRLLRCGQRCFSLISSRAARKIAHGTQRYHRYGGNNSESPLR